MGHRLKETKVICIELLYLNVFAWSNFCLAFEVALKLWTYKMYVKPITFSRYFTLLFECVKRSRCKIEIHTYFHLFSLIIRFTSITDKLWKFKVCRELSRSEQHLWHGFIFDVIRSTRDFLKVVFSSPKEPAQNWYVNDSIWYGQVKKRLETPGCKVERVPLVLTLP